MNAAAFLLLGSILTIPAYGQESLVDWTMRHEGFAESRYNDSRGYATIGYGHRVTHNGPGSFRVTEAEAKRTLIADLQLAQDHVTDLCHTIESKPTPVKFVLTALAFQLGKTGLWKFKKMWHAIDANNWGVAATELRDSTLFQQCPRRTGELATILESATDAR